MPSEAALKLQVLLLRITALRAGYLDELDFDLQAAIAATAVPGDAMALTPAERLVVQALLIDDTTPFSGADIDVNIGSRAAPGDAMALTPAERLVVQALIIDDTTPFSGADIATILADIAEGKERRWKETYIYETEYEQITNAGEESVTPPTGISPAFPAGATLRRAILVAALKANNDTAALHKIGVTLQYQIAGGGWNDLIDLTASPTLMLPEVEGTGDAITIVEDMTGLFTSGQLVEVQFLVDSTNAAAVNYSTTFVLSLEFDLV